MKRQFCKAKSAAKDWDDAISLARAKIRELKKAIGVFERCRNSGAEWPAGYPDDEWLEKWLKSTGETSKPQ